MYFVLDFGGTNLRLSGSNDLSKFELISNLKKIPNTGDYDADSKKVIKSMKAMSGKASGIVIGIPGDFDYDRLTLRRVNNLKNWVNKPFFRTLETEFGVSPRIFKDSILAGIGEGMESKTLKSHFLYISWGTGIGGCLVTQREDGLPNITTLNWDKVFSQIESTCGGKNIEKIYGQSVEKLNKSQWNDLISILVNEINNICKTLNINYVILGGGITAKIESTALQIAEQIEKHNIKLIPSRLGDNSAIYGGYHILKNFKIYTEINEKTTNTNN